MKFALRGLMSATVVGAAITLLGIGLEKLISHFTGASDASDKLKQSVSDTGHSFESQRDQALAPTLTKYQELQAKWKSLKSVHEKNDFLKANKTAFEQLGVSIDGVGQAESFFVSNDEKTAQGLQAQYEDLEQKSKSLKLAIGLEQPEPRQVKTYVEKLQERLTAAQADMDNATTIEARVTASAKVEEIQAEIDKATKGELTIKADVEPAYVRRGSLADKRQSYQNAQAKVSRIQEDYEIGIIGKEEAEAQIEEVNKQIEKLGINLKPLKLEVDDKSLDAIRNLGNIDLTNFESVQNALLSVNDITNSTAKGFAAIGAGAAAMGSAMQQLGSDTGAAKAGMVIAAIGQIVLSYAAAMTSAAKTGWVSWLAFGLTGAAQLASIIATVKGFPTGGVVGGNSTTGDKVPIRVNSGEMVLTKTQQARLFAMANGQLSPSVNLPGALTPSLAPSFRAPASDQGGKIELVLKGDTATAQISNHTLLQKKIGKRLAL